MAPITIGCPVNHVLPFRLPARPHAAQARARCVPKVGSPWEARHRDPKSVTKAPRLATSLGLPRAIRDNRELGAALPPLL